MNLTTISMPPPPKKRERKIEKKKKCFARYISYLNKYKTKIQITIYSKSNCVNYYKIKAYLITSTTAMLFTGNRMTLLEQVTQAFFSCDLGTNVCIT